MTHPTGEPATYETYGEGTLLKVRAALRNTIGSEQVITDCISDMQNQGILFRERGTAADVSDGSHTMQELYDHRCALTAVLATIGAIDGEAWRSKQHHPSDAPMFDGYFIVGIELPAGTISYHYPLADWDGFAAVQELEHAPKWDGHTSADVVARLADFTRVLGAAVAEAHAAGDVRGSAVSFVPPAKEDLTPPK